jgi:hypothetical protein
VRDESALASRTVGLAADLVSYGLAVVLYAKIRVAADPVRGGEPRARRPELAPRKG